MKKVQFLKLSVIFLFISSLNHAQENENSLFWKVSGNGLAKPSYLFGTVHMIAQKDFFLPDSVEEIIKSCDQVTLEVDLDDPELMPKMQSLIFMKDSSFKQLLNKKDYDRLSVFFRDSLGQPMEMLGNIKPLFLLPVIMPRIVNSPVASYEFKFIDLAKKYNKDVTGLETIEEELGDLDKISYKQQAEMLLETIDKMDSSRILYTQLIDSYKKMDIKKLYEIDYKMQGDAREFSEVLLVNRNLRWLPRIEDMAKTKSCFIACGTLHLAGPQGLVAMLRDKGYTVTPVK